MELVLFELLHGLVNAPAVLVKEVFVKDQFPDSVDDQPNGVVVCPNACHARNHRLCGLVGLLVLSPEGAFEHEARGHLEGQEVNPERFVKRHDTCLFQRLQGV